MANKQKRFIKLQQQQQFDALYRKDLNRNKEVQRMSKNPMKVIDLAYSGILMKSESYGKVINKLIEYLRPTQKNKRKSDAFYHFLQSFTNKRVSKKIFEEVQWVNALYALSLNKKDWIRDLKDWTPLKTRQVKKQFGHLVRFLFAKFDVPVFMDKAFYTNHQQNIRWFIWIGSGYNIRNASGLPFPLTKKMAHHFLQAPNDSSITEAFRWGQVLGMGGDALLARNLVATKLGEATEHEGFWKTVIAFFIKNPMLDSAQIAPIIDYILHQKFQNARLFRNGIYINQAPPNPNWSIKGRTATSLLRVVNEWHSQINRIGNFSNDTSWLAYPIKDFTYKEGSEHDYKTYRIQQLVNYHALRIEGGTMRHCVASYIYSCLRGSCSIWSLSVEGMNGNIEKLVTIELTRNKVIVQARKKHNALPKPKDKQIIQRWCTMEGLQWSKWLR